MGRSIMAVAAGFLFIAMLAFGMDMVMKQVMPGAFNAEGHIESVPMLLFAMFYVAVFAIAGCYLAARLAPNRPMRHALILGALGLVFNLIAATQVWDTAPAWYFIASLVLVMPYAWIGGKIRENQIAGGEGMPGA